MGEKKGHRYVLRPYKERAHVALGTATMVMVYLRLCPHQDVSCRLKLFVVGGQMRKVFG